MRWRWRSPRGARGWRSPRATASASNRWPRNAARGAAKPAPCPPTSPTQQDCEWLVAETVKAFGGIDVVIHNAGITMWSRFDALQDLSIFERHHGSELPGARAPHRAVVAASQAVEGIAGGGGEPRRAHRRARTLGLRGEQARDDRVLRFAAHRAARQRRRRERDRAGFRGDARSTSAPSGRMASRSASRR